MILTLKDLDLPIRLRTENPLSDQEFLRFCAANEPMQFEKDGNGEIIVMSPNGTGGGGAESEALVELSIWARRDARGRAFNSNTGFRLRDGSVRAADAAWVSWKLLEVPMKERREGYWPVCPEFVIEIRSESDRLKPLQEKMPMWLANGVELAWLIDPERRAVEVYRAGSEAEVYENPSSVQGTGPASGFELVMSRIWD